MMFNQWFRHGVADVKLIDFHVEDEGCPHIFFSVHTPINFLHGAKAQMETLKISARVFVTGSECLAIDGYILTVEEEFNFAEFHNQFEKQQITVEKAVDDFKTKLKVNLAEQCMFEGMTSELETKVFSLCQTGEININQIELMDNVSRAVILIDETMTEFKKLLELSITLKQVDQIA
ncbi:hypothetical protein [Acinetobacter indicus]|uniref:hypothetical protein n=1 Tax=Acinetobacter indicus TaxID=756892 RepID=UPI003988CA15